MSTDLKERIISLSSDGEKTSKIVPELGIHQSALRRVLKNSKQMEPLKVTIEVDGQD